MTRLRYPSISMTMPSPKMTREVAEPSSAFTMDNNITYFRYDPHQDANVFPVSSGLLFVGLMLLLFMPGWLFIVGLVFLMLPTLRL